LIARSPYRIDFGADPHAPGKNGKTPADLAGDNGHESLAEYLKITELKPDPRPVKTETED
jgi:hypothetical protein